MKRTAVLVNTSRGNLVDEVALADAIMEGRLAGVGLDTLTEEPPEPESALLKMDDVLITPHTAWMGDQCWERVFVQAFENLDQILEGNNPQWQV